jgi:hypothetical protein
MLFEWSVGTFRDGLCLLFILRGLYSYVSEAFDHYVDLPRATIVRSSVLSDHYFAAKLNMTFFGKEDWVPDRTLLPCGFDSVKTLGINRA